MYWRAPQARMRNVSWVTRWRLIFFFLCASPPPTPPLLPTTDYPSTKQRWHQSGRPIARSYPQSTTSANNFTQEQETKPAEIPQIPDSDHLESVPIPLWNFTYSFFFYKKQKRRKKKNRKTKRLLPVGLLIAAETCFWEDYFLFGGMIIDACACK